MASWLSAFDLRASGFRPHTVSKIDLIDMMISSCPSAFQAGQLTDSASSCEGWTCLTIMVHRQLTTAEVQPDSA